MNKMDVLCYGEIGIDNLIQAERLPAPEYAVFPTSDSYHIGGAAANTSVWLSELGIKTALCGNVIGMDLYGSWLWEWLSTHAHLNLSNVRRQDGISTPFTRAIVTPDGERSFLIFHYPQTPKVPLTREICGDARFVALDLYGGPERLAAAKLAIETGARTAIGDVISLDHPALPFTSIATNSCSFIQDSLPDIDAVVHSYALQAVSKGIVITTNGAKPVHIIDNSGHSFQVQPPEVKVVDATGAGDAFRSGLLYGLVRNFSLEKSVCYGVACGSLKVQFLGAASRIPSLRDIEELADTLRPI